MMYLVLAAVLALAWLSIVVVRFVRLPAAARHYWFLARLHRVRWRRISRNLGLARVDKHTGRVNTPPARFRPDAYGWVVKVKLIPGVSRPEFEDNAHHLANAMGCWRVGISQPKPGRLVVRAMRRDPLAEVLSSDVLPPFDGRRLLLGRDEFGTLRFARLDTISGSVIGGLPGRGKTLCAASFAVQ